MKCDCFLQERYIVNVEKYSLLGDLELQVSLSYFRGASIYFIRRKRLENYTKTVYHCTPLETSAQILLMTTYNGISNVDCIYKVKEVNKRIGNNCCRSTPHFHYLFLS